MNERPATARTSLQDLEDEGRPDGAHDEHGKRAEVKDGSSGEKEDVTKANQEANDQFNENGKWDGKAADIRPPSTVAPD